MACPMTWKNVVAQRAAAAEYLRPSRSGWMLLPAVFKSSPLSFVENSVDNTPVKGFASDLSVTLDRRVAARVSNERGLRL